MSAIFLSVVGVLMLFNGLPVLGLISVVTAVLLPRACEKLWCVILGAVLLVITPYWPVGIVSIALGVLTPNPHQPNRPSMHNIRF